MFMAGEKVSFAAFRGINVLQEKTDPFHIPTNLEHGAWQCYGKTRIFYEAFGYPISVFSLTLNVEP
ncbi:MAG: hypothetical protein BA861_00575 [Desulfobacterales bacterium S3730MH5]|nr:MAG: hypothetical protein BA861_00575 [Desulfobacterales bacterium S3730MH5]